MQQPPVSLRTICAFLCFPVFPTLISTPLSEVTVHTTFSSGEWCETGGFVTIRPLCSTLVLVDIQAEEDRKVVLAKRFNVQLQKGLHESLSVWKEEEELN